MVRMLAAECGGLLGVRHRQGGAAVPRCGGGDEVVQLGRVRAAPGGAWRKGRIVVESGSGRGEGRGGGAGRLRVQAVASAYPPIAQTEKTFRLPIDYYQVRS
jgi:hypothetical protein